MRHCIVEKFLLPSSVDFFAKVAGKNDGETEIRRDHDGGETVTSEKAVLVRKKKMVETRKRRGGNESIMARQQGKLGEFCNVKGIHVSAWLHLDGSSAMAKSFNNERMKQNIESEDDLEKIKQIPQRRQ
ncbi:hypothetical protein QL285_032350 [Trifolium repens]|nr:hypothetical protein QL285_032350 [Trifolium repens]